MKESDKRIVSIIDAVLQSGADANVEKLTVTLEVFIGTTIRLPIGITATYETDAPLEVQEEE